MTTPPKHYQNTTARPTTYAGPWPIFPYKKHHRIIPPATAVALESPCTRIILQRRDLCTNTHTGCHVRRIGCCTRHCILYLSSCCWLPSLGPLWAWGLSCHCAR